MAFVPVIMTDTGRILKQVSSYQEGLDYIKDMYPFAEVSHTEDGCTQFDCISPCMFIEFHYPV